MRAFSIFVAIVRFIASALNRILARGATSGARLSVERGERVNAGPSPNFRLNKGYRENARKIDRGE